MLGDNQTEKTPGEKTHFAASHPELNCLAKSGSIIADSKLILVSIS